MREKGRSWALNSQTVSRGWKSINCSRSSWRQENCTEKMVKRVAVEESSDCEDQFTPSLEGDVSEDCGLKPTAVMKTSV